MKKLYRSRSDRKIAGVCGGMAEYFVVDSTVIRLISVLIFVFTGFFPFLFVYLLAWLIIPEKPTSFID